ncbi:hypothetical protein [Elioraea sp.]|uniref:hypothetical protein n=1 Tax=Elioraea sp. TaxID=2185103 RepID=UPI003F706A3E
MTDWTEVARRVIAAIPAEQLRGAVLYLDRRVIEPGKAVSTGRDTLTAGQPSALAFLDLAPEANWGHRCRYLLIDLVTGAVQGTDATHPPFLRGAAPTLHAIAKGATVPDWTLAAPFDPPD